MCIQLIKQDLEAKKSSALQALFASYTQQILYFSPILDQLKSQEMESCGRCMQLEVQVITSGALRTIK